LEIEWVKRIDYPRRIFEQGEYLYVCYDRRIEKRSKVNGELIKSRSVEDIDIDPDTCTVGEKKKTAPHTRVRSLF